MSCVIWCDMATCRGTCGHMLLEVPSHRCPFIRFNHSDVLYTGMRQLVRFAATAQLITTPRAFNLLPQTWWCLHHQTTGVGAVKQSHVDAAQCDSSLKWVPELAQKWNMNLQSSAHFVCTCLHQCTDPILVRPLVGSSYTPGGRCIQCCTSCCFVVMGQRGQIFLA